jgi:hypothetical protein
VDLTAVSTIQLREDNATDVFRNRFRFVEDSLIVWVRFVLFVTVRWKMAFWVPRDCDIRVPGFDDTVGVLLDVLLFWIKHNRSQNQQHPNRDEYRLNERG